MSGGRNEIAINSFMRIREITEAVSPEEVVRTISSESGQEILIIGGRVISGEKIQSVNNAFKKINLKNVRAPQGKRLLFHGSGYKFDKFDKMSWFSTEPFTALFHSSFSSAVGYTKEQYLYVCYADVSNVYDSSDIVPGKEQVEDLKKIYKQGYDAIKLTDVSDAGVGPKTDIYNIKNGDDVKILKRWPILHSEVTDEEIEKIISGELSPKDIESNRTAGVEYDYVITDPGFTYFDLNQKVTAQELKQALEMFGKDSFSYKPL